MKTFALIAAAVALLAILPASTQTASAEPVRLAQADVSVRIVGDGVRIGTDRRRHWRHHHAECRMVTIRERRGNTIYVKKIRRC